MHIPDGFLSAPVNAATFATSIAVGAYALARTKKRLSERQAPLLGVTAAFIFAAQTINFPVAAGTSGHFLGAAFAAILLGPSAGFLVISVTLIIQCMFFADGGITSLGSNIFNMAIVGLGCATILFNLLKAVLPETKSGYLLAASVSSWVSIVATSAICALELSFSGTAPLSIVLPALTGVHSIIGIGEAIITTVILSFLLSVRPDIVRFKLATTG